MFALFFQLGTFCPCVLKRNGLFAPIAARLPYSHLKIQANVQLRAKHAIPFENEGAKECAIGYQNRGDHANHP
jgi:hypothetical protein